MELRRVFLPIVLLFGSALWMQALAKSPPATATTTTSPSVTLRQQATAGDAEAQAKLGLDLIKSKSPTDKAAAIEWFRKSAEHGNADGEWNLGTAYFVGNGVSRDVSTGLDWMRRSLSDGSGNHMFMYGMMLATFGGDPHQGMAWAHKSAEAGFAPGMMMWSMAELSGKNGIPQNKADAEQWMLRAAKTGSAFAQMALGHFYIDGTFGKPDVQTGLHWLQQAATQGYPRAEGALGVFLVTGDKSVPRNPAQGIEWAEKAAAQHDAFGYYALGYAYEHGEGTPMNPEKAWYNFAAAQRVDIQHELPAAADAMSKVATGLSSAQVAQLQTEVAKIPVPKKSNHFNTARFQ